MNLWHRYPIASLVLQEKGKKGGREQEGTNSPYKTKPKGDQILKFNLFLVLYQLRWSKEEQ